MSHSLLQCVYMQSYVTAEWEKHDCVCVCDYAYSTRLMRRVLIQQRKNKIDAGNMHDIMFLHADSRPYCGDNICSVCKD